MSYNSYRCKFGSNYILWNSVTVARQTLTLFVRVRILLLQPKNSSSVKSAAAIFFSTGCSAVGSAPGSGLGGRGFESRHSDHEKTVDFCRRSFAMPLFMLGCRIFGKGKSYNYTHKIKLSDKTFYTCYNINCKKGAI